MEKTVFGETQNRKSVTSSLLTRLVNCKFISRGSFEDMEDFERIFQQSVRSYHKRSFQKKRPTETPLVYIYIYIYTHTYIHVKKLL